MNTRRESDLVVQDLTFRYLRSSAPTLVNVTVDFRPGQMVAIVGPSGSGKSTMLYVVGLLLKPTAGDVRVCGISTLRMRDADRSALRASQIGFVFQDAALDPTRTVLANVCEGALYAGMTRREAQRGARQWLSRMGVELRIESRPGEISGGQAARVSLCRALLKGPRIVLADEPTGNLDAETAALVLGSLRESASQGATVVIASHDPLVIEDCDESVDVAVV